MATKVESTANYEAFEMRGAGMLVRNVATGGEVFFQPGDDAGIFREALSSLDEVPEARRAEVFEVLCSQYV